MTGDLLGRVFDQRYRVNELIGSGGMGSVYRATHLEMNREVALKVLERGVADSDKQVQRFYQEARASSRLQHPNTIRVFDFGRAEDGRLYLAMEYLKGETLTELMKRAKSIGIKRLCQMMRQVCKSLAEAHQVGIIHRDLKPDNIFITEIFGEKDFVKVLDFGIAKSTEGEEQESLTQTGFICGTPRYLSPEQALGKDIDARSDLYSVGIMMFEAIAGEPPFSAATPIALVMKHIHEHPPVLPSDGTPEGQWMSELVGRCMQKLPEKRPSSSVEVSGILDAILAGQQPEGFTGETLSRSTQSMRGPSRQQSGGNLKQIPSSPLARVYSIGNAAAEETLMLDSSELIKVATGQHEQEQTPAPANKRDSAEIRVKSQGGSNPTVVARTSHSDLDEPTKQDVAVMLPKAPARIDDEPTNLTVQAVDFGAESNIIIIPQAAEEDLSEPDLAVTSPVDHMHEEAFSPMTRVMESPLVLPEEEVAPEAMVTSNRWTTGVMIGVVVFGIAAGSWLANYSFKTDADTSSKSPAPVKVPSSSPVIQPEAAPVAQPESVPEQSDKSASSLTAPSKAVDNQPAARAPEGENKPIKKRELTEQNAPVAPKPSESKTTPTPSKSDLKAPVKAESTPKLPDSKPVIHVPSVETTSKPTVVVPQKTDSEPATAIVESVDSVAPKETKQSDAVLKKPPQKKKRKRRRWRRKPSFNPF